MDDGSVAELRRLQLRAYAPDGDIQDDDDAARRLERLEDLRRASRFAASPDPAEANSIAVSSEGPGPEQSASPVAPPIDAVEPAAARPRVASRRRWWALLWAASLIVVGAVAGGTALSAAPRAPLAADAHFVATLAQDPEFTWPKFLGDPGEDATGFRDYLGLTAIAMGGANWDTNVEKCFLLVPTEKLEVDSESFGGPMFSGCSAGAFPATVEILVRGDLPAELLQRFPDGSALQFVLDGSRVDVYSDAE